MSSALQNKIIKTIIFRIQTYDSVMCRYFCVGFTDFMFKGKTLTEYRNLFSPNNYEFWVISKMNENNSIEVIDKTNLTEQTKFRLSEIIGIENHIYQEINQRKSCSKKLNKHATVFDYIEKVLIVLSGTGSGVSIISFTSIVGSPVGIVSASFTLFFSRTTGIVKKLLNITRNKKKKHDRVLMLAKGKFNSIETLTSQALIDMEISHE